MTVDRMIWKILLDLVVLACMGLLLLALIQWATPYERGYFVDDESLRLPYKPDTISVVLLACTGFALTIVTVIATELVRDKQGKGIGEKFLSGSIVPGWVWASYTTIGIYSFGVICEHLTSSVGKYVIGRLRPHFFDVCEPVPVESSPLNTFGYIQDYTCSGTNDELIRDIRLSFPSAHSGFAMYTAIFFIFYLQVKAKWRGSKLLCHGVQYAAIIAAWYVGLSRISDHKHHWSDVAAGFGIGAAYAVLIFIFVLKPRQFGPPAVWQEPSPPNMLPRPVLSR